MKSLDRARPSSTPRTRESLPRRRATDRPSGTRDRVNRVLDVPARRPDASEDGSHVGDAEGTQKMRGHV